MTAAIVGLLTVWLVRARLRSELVALSLIIGGASGNLIDRLHDGAVTDFLDFYVGRYHWPAFTAPILGSPPASSSFPSQVFPPPGTPHEKLFASSKTVRGPVRANFGTAFSFPGHPPSRPPRSPFHRPRPWAAGL